MAQSCNYGVVKPFKLHILLLEIRCHGDFLYPGEVTEGSKELAHKLESNISQYIQRYFICHNSVVQGYCRYLCVVDFVWGNRLCRFEELVCFHNGILTSIFRRQYRSKNINGYELKCLCSCEQLKVPPKPHLRFTLGARCIGVQVCTHPLPSLANKIVVASCLTKVCPGVSSRNMMVEIV